MTGASRPDLGAEVMRTLAALKEAAPGNLVEVRVPPHGAVQVLSDPHASGHRRGTPRAVVETDAVTWLALTTGDLAWDDAVASGRVFASGERADLSQLLPLA